MSREVFITGFPRSGTTFIVTMYHRMGYDTGYSDKLPDYLQSPFHLSHGGLELTRDHVQRRKDHLLERVEVVKHPWPVGDRYRPWQHPKVVELGPFKHHIVMRRDVHDMVRSQVRSSVLRMNRQGDPQIHDQDRLTAIHLAFARDNLEALLEAFGSPIEIQFPRCVQDFGYLWKKIEPTVSGRVSKTEAREVWDLLANPAYVAPWRLKT